MIDQFLIIWITDHYQIVARTEES